jgi:hypothetical protein
VITLDEIDKAFAVAADSQTSAKVLVEVTAP